MKRRGKDQRSEGRTRRQFTQEFKLEAVRLAAVGNRRVSDVAEELGIRPDMLRQWKRQAQGRVGQAGPEIFPGNGKLTSQDEEVRRLRRENAQLRDERDILGKAMAFFARTVR